MAKKNQEREEERKAYREGFEKGKSERHAEKLKKLHAQGYEDGKTTRMEQIKKRAGNVQKVVGGMGQMFGESPSNSNKEGKPKQKKGKSYLDFVKEELST